MRLLHGVSALLVALSCCVADESVKEAAQKALDAFSASWFDQAVSLSVRADGLSFDVAAGKRRLTDDSYTIETPGGSPGGPEDEVDASARVTDHFLFGSGAKFHVALGVVRAAERGFVSLDEPAAPFVDRYLAANGTTFAGLYGPLANNITIRHLLAMRSGLRDYDDDHLLNWQLSVPHKDITPVDVLHYTPDKSFRCYPGQCGGYTSLGYTILGLVLAGVYNPGGAWDGWDERLMLTGYPGALYVNGGTLSEQKRRFSEEGIAVAHGYQQAPDGTRFRDLWGVSALGGWTCGNLLANTPTEADLAFEMFTGKPSPERKDGALGFEPPVTRESLREMLEFTYLDDTMSWTGSYGLGVQMLPQGTEKSGTYLGHGGVTYGFEGSVAFNTKLNFSLSIAGNLQAASGWHLGTVHTEVYHMVVRALCPDGSCNDDEPPRCQDDVGFVDEGGLPCEDWKKYNCSDALQKWHYTPLGADLVPVHCPAACGLAEACDPDKTGVQRVDARPGWYYHDRLVGSGLFDRVMGVGQTTVEACVDACEADPYCRSFSATVAPAGYVYCLLRTRCVSPVELSATASVSTVYGMLYRTYFKPCLAAYSPGSAAQPFWLTAADETLPRVPSEVIGALAAAAESESAEAFDARCSRACVESPACASVVVEDETCSLSTRAVAALGGDLAGALYAELPRAVTCGGFPDGCAGSLGNVTSLEACFALCNARDYISTIPQSRCKGVSYHAAGEVCALLDAELCHERSVYTEVSGAAPSGDPDAVGWVTHAKGCHFRYIPPAGGAGGADAGTSGDPAVEGVPGVNATLGECFDMCLVGPSKMWCRGLAWARGEGGNATCRNLPEAAVEAALAGGRGGVWVRYRRAASMYEPELATGCCVADAGMVDGVTEAACALRGHRYLFREGTTCTAMSAPPAAPGRTQAPGGTSEAPLDGQASPAPPGSTGAPLDAAGSSSSGGEGGSDGSGEGTAARGGFMHSWLFFWLAVGGNAAVTVALLAVSLRKAGCCSSASSSSCCCCGGGGAGGQPEDPPPHEMTDALTEAESESVPLRTVTDENGRDGLFFPSASHEEVSEKATPTDIEVAA
ncbi:hypothetical protein DIPPA_20336 [Diplonema papillatum]|nr:hypothetical protein DIPPA_20336 [Diplonema papillatum]